MLANDKADTLVDDALQAFKVCRQTAAYCLDKGGDFALPRRLQLLHDAADANLLLADLLLRASPNFRQAIPFCRDVSQACADVIEAVEHDDPQLRAAYAALHRACSNCSGLLSGRQEEHEDVVDEAVRESFPASDPLPPPS